MHFGLIALGIGQKGNVIFEVLMAVNIMVMLWLLAPFSFVGRYQRFSYES
jgi:hypothetical protein